MPVMSEFRRRWPEVEVDLDTGEVHVLQMVAAHDIGRAINPLALQEAMQQAQMMLEDPNADLNGDGVPDSYEEKIQQAQMMLEQAAVQPFPYEDYGAHIQTHGSFMKSNEFSKLSPEVQQGFVDHYLATQQAASSIPPPVEPRAPQVTLQMKGTLGPTAAAEILNKAGVTEVTPEQMAEQPLETWVTDSLDKPDVEEAGNDPFTQADQAVQQDLAQQKQDVSAMQTAHSAALSHQAAARKAQESEQQMAQSEEQHDQKLRHAEEAHRQKLRLAQAQARQQAKQANQPQSSRK